MAAVEAGPFCHPFRPGSKRFRGNVRGSLRSSWFHGRDVLRREWGTPGENVLSRCELLPGRATRIMRGHLTAEKS